MAEFLVYNTTHWMDSVSEKEREKWNDNMLAKYNARYQKGDIVEVYPDGRCKEKPSPNSKFVIVKVLALSFKDAKHLMENLVDTAKDMEMLKRRRYKIDPKAIDVPTKEVNIDNTTFQSLIMDKKIG